MYKLNHLNEKFATDTLFSKKNSLNHNSGAQIYSHKCGFNATYPMGRAKGDIIGQSYKDFINEYGVPEHLTVVGDFWIKYLGTNKKLSKMRQKVSFRRVMILSHLEVRNP